MSRLANVLRVTCIAALALPLLATRATALWPTSPSANVPVSAAAGNQTVPAIIPVGTGGTITVWADLRGANQDIYARRVGADGVPQWTLDGVAVCTAAGAQSTPVLVSDGAGGAIVAWSDARVGATDIYVQKLDASGVPQWAPNGVALCTAAAAQANPAIVSDGAGGAIVVWTDARVGNDVFAQRVNGAGVPQWAPDGVSLGGEPLLVAVASDGAGGAIATWKDARGFGFSIMETYARRINAAGVAQWAADGVLIGSWAVSGANDLALALLNPAVIVDDGAGGAVIAWTDVTTLGSDGNIFAQRVNSTGTVQWAGGGVALCALAGAQTLPRIASDAASGAVVVWQDSRGATQDIYARRVSAAGVPMWAADGVALCAAAGAQAAAVIGSDGSGGAVTAWQDLRAGTQDIYAQRINAGGVVQWMADGLAVSAATGNQTSPAIASEGNGSGVVAWQDLRGANQDIYAQRVAWDGCLGQGMLLVSVRDVPNDQGGRVKLSWDAACVDVSPPYSIESYRIWRSAPPNAVQSALAHGARIVGPDQVIARGGPDVLLATPMGATTYYWEAIATQPSGRLEHYGYVAATTSDSVASSNPYTAFMIQALSTGGIPAGVSNPDSGYSVDNLGPAAPAMFSAQFFPGPPPGSARLATSGYTWLHWSPSTEPDFLEYRLHRGSSADFVPGPGNLLVAKSDTGHIDVGTQGDWYKLLALDTHGNASVSALLTPGDVLGVDPSAVREGLWLGPVRPNPARSNALFTFRLPREGDVSLRIFDVRGRLVRQLVGERMPPGEHVVRWDTRDLRGRTCQSGVYVSRLEMNGVPLHEKFVLTR